MNNAIKISYLFAACQIYGCLGAVFGTCSIMTMVVIGYDRYNVIVKGFSGPKIGPGMVSTKITIKKFI
jgi:r-opsin